MWRPIFYEVILFAIPFALYALWLFMRHGVDPTRRAAWRDAPFVALVVGALILTIAGMVAVGHLDKAPAGSAYQPARLENGKLVQPELK